MIARVLTALDRRLVAVRRRHSRIRHLVPARLVSRTRGVQGWLDPLRHILFPPIVRTPHANLFHCSIHKTGSQWIRSLLTDFRTYQYTGLRPYNYRPQGGDRRPIQDRTFVEFPTRTLITPLYTTFENFRAIPKAGSYRAFFILRDPRDVLVSWYFSAKHSHVVEPDPTRPLVQARQALATLSEAEGLCYGVDYLTRMGRFAALRSWATAPAQDASVTLVRFEDLIGPNSFASFRGLFDFLDIPLPDRDLEAMLDAYSFEKLSGRKRGTENPRSHLRSGAAGGWRKRFTPAVEAYFREATADLVVQLGYTW